MESLSNDYATTVREKGKLSFEKLSLVSRSLFDPGLRSSFYLMETLCFSKSVLKNGSDHLRKGNPDGERA